MLINTQPPAPASLSPPRVPERATANITLSVSTFEPQSHRAEPSRAMVLKMKRGFYCSVSLRACTITLGCINLMISMLSVAMSESLMYAAMEHPAETLHDDFDLYDEDTTDHHVLEHDLHEHDEHDGVVTTTTENPFVHEYRVILVVAIVFDVINLVLCLVDIVLSTVLIYGAARSKAALIRPWLFIGATMVAYDVLYFVVHTAIGVHFSMSLNEIFHIPFVAYLWVVAWNFYLDCRDMERRAETARVSMSVLGKDGPDAEDTVLPYGMLVNA